MRKQTDSRVSVGFLRAGVARREITICQDDIPVNDPLFVKALVLADEETVLVIVTMDAVAIGGIADIRDDFLPLLRKRLERELGIPAGNVLVNASHTHPSNTLLCDPDEQIGRALAAIRDAQSAMEPVKTGAGCGYEDRIIINRVLRLKNGRAWTIRLSNPCPPDDLVEGVKPIDPQIGLLRIDRMDGTPLAVLYNYACHTLIGVPSGAITANFPGFASEVIEENLPGAMALFLQGAAGDVTELLYKDVNRPRDARPLGMMLGLSVLKAVRQIETSRADLRVINESIRLPRRGDSVEQVATRLREQAELLASLRFTSLNLKSFLPLYLKHLASPRYPSDYSYRYLQEEALGVADLVHMDTENRRSLDKYLHNVQVMERLTLLVDDIETLKKHQTENTEAGGKPIETEVMGVKIGDFVLITSATEVSTEIALEIKAKSPYKHTYISAFTNGYLHYGSPAADYPSGNYEVTECLLAPEWHGIFEEKVFAILERL